jgi:hypothetical protein
VPDSGTLYDGNDCKIPFMPGWQRWARLTLSGVKLILVFDPKLDLCAV